MPVHKCAASWMFLYRKPGILKISKLKEIKWLSAHTTWTDAKQLQNKGKSPWSVAYLGAVTIATCCTVGYSKFYAQNTRDSRQKLVILGTGWGAVSLLRKLKPGTYDVSIVSPQNYFLFTPLVPSVTVGTVEGRSIVEPIRKVIGRKLKEDVKFFEAECIDVDIDQKQVACADYSDIVGEKSNFTLDYDILIVSVGAQTGTYNIPGVKENAHMLRDLKHAQKIRKNIMDSFETAAIPGQSDEEVKRLLHFVVVGGGPAGVEFVAELRDFVKGNLRKYYPDRLVDQASITLIDGFNKLLNTYDEEISRYTEAKFYGSGIEVVKNTFVVELEKNSISLKDVKSGEVRKMPYGMCVWAAGSSPQTLTKKLMSKIPGQKNKNALVTDMFLKVKNSDNIFAIGDCATVEFDRMLWSVDKLFQEADVNGDGYLQPDEFKNILEIAKKRYPQVVRHFNYAFEKSVLRQFEAADEDKDKKLSIEDFRKVLQIVDSKLTYLPPTAQVAAQGGKYLASVLNSHPNAFISKDFKDIKPFEYRHFGSLAYLGDNEAAIELPIIGSFKGWGAMLLWRAAYTSECISFRMRFLIVLDWIKSAIFGRDISRI